MFEAIVSNPPFSIAWDGPDLPGTRSDPRFCGPDALAPKSRADLSFVLHSLSLLKPGGRAAIVLFPGALYRGGAERKIRQWLVLRGCVDRVIQLPPNLFYGTGIPTCVMVLWKGRNPELGVRFTDASMEFVKDGKKNRLSKENIESIMFSGVHDAFRATRSRNVDAEEIEANGFSLLPATYLIEKPKRQEVDIDILKAQIRAIVARQDKLREDLDAIVAEIEGFTGGAK